MQKMLEAFCTQRRSSKGFNLPKAQSRLIGETLSAPLVISKQELSRQIREFLSFSLFWGGTEQQQQQQKRILCVGDRPTVRNPKMNFHLGNYTTSLKVQFTINGLRLTEEDGNNFGLLRPDEINLQYLNLPILMQLYELSMLTVL